MLPMVLQNSIVQLCLEHRNQRERLRTHHNSAYALLCESWNNHLQEQLNDFQWRCWSLDEQISQIEDTGNINGTSDSQYGPPVLVKLRKAPSKATLGKHSMVTVCLSARIAQAITLEDHVFDHFYTYK